MRRTLLLALVPLLAIAVGCVPDGTGTMLVPESPFGAPPTARPPVTRAAFRPAPQEVAAPVDSLFRNILAANKQIGIRPQLVVVGVQQPEIFHRGTSELIITEGLVKQCAGDTQLAALLCHELGKMVSEREALAAPNTRFADRDPPMDVPIGNDRGGMFGPPDGTRLAEQARFHPPARREPPPPPPDPDVLARDYLTKAGMAPAELDGVAPLLKTAEASSSVEKQMTNPGPAPLWTTK